MKSFLIKVVLFALFPLGICIILLCTELKRDFAWTSAPEDCEARGSWIYHRLFAEPTSIDIALIGTSRTITGIQDTLMSRIMSDSAGRAIEVVNLGYCRFGSEMQYVIAKDLIQQKKVNTIIFEVNEGLSGTSHPIYPYYSSTEDLLMPASVLNQATPSNYYKGFLARLTQFRQRAFQIPVPVQPNLPNYGYRGYPGSADSTTLIEPDAPSVRKMNMLKRFDKIYPESWIEKCMALCKDHGIKVYFLYLPSYHDQPEPQEELAFYQSHAIVLIPPSKMLRQKNLWREHDHLNDQGASLLSAWLVGQLLRE